MRGYVPDQMPQRDDALNRTSACRAPLVWRAPEGPGTSVGQRSNTRNHAGPGCGAGGRWQGLEGCWDDAPSEARGADGSRAGCRPPACQAARPHSKVRRCPEHPWNHTPPSAISQNTQPAASPGGRPRGPRAGLPGCGTRSRPPDTPRPAEHEAWAAANAMRP